MISQMSKKEDNILILGITFAQLYKSGRDFRMKYGDPPTRDWKSHIR